MVLNILVVILQACIWDCVSTLVCLQNRGLRRKHTSLFAVLQGSPYSRETDYDAENAEDDPNLCLG